MKSSKIAAGTYHWSTLGDLVVNSLLDGPIDVWLVCLNPICRVRSNLACSLAGDPVCDATRRRFCVDLRQRITWGQLICPRARQTTV